MKSPSQLVSEASACFDTVASASLLSRLLSFVHQHLATFTSSISKASRSSPHLCLLSVYLFSTSLATSGKLPGTFRRHAGVICHPGPRAGPPLSLALSYPAIISSTFSIHYTGPYPTPAPSSGAQGSGGWRGKGRRKSSRQPSFTGLFLQGNGSPRDGTPALRPQAAGDI